MKKRRTKAQISDLMRKVKSEATEPEKLFRSALRELGIKAQFNASKLPGKPDVVLPKERVAVFIDGDFWHGHQWVHRKLPSLEDQFHKGALRKRWTLKIRRNMQRDSAVTAALLARGWNVVRFWATDVSKNPRGCVQAVKVAAEMQPDPLIELLAPKTVAEFFAGMGLVRFGLQKQGWTVSFANDNDPDKKDLYETHFGKVENHFVLDDVHNLAGSEIPSVTLATASFPCNDLSLAGSRGGLHAKNSSAFWGFVEVIRSMGERKPPLILLENVPGFITSHDGKDFRAALLALNELGYVVDPFLLDAANFVPQSRLRLFVVAIRQDFPHAIESPIIDLAADSMLRPKLLSSFIKAHPEIIWYLRNLPMPPLRNFDLEQLLEDLPDYDPQWWSSERAEYLFSQFSAKHRAIAQAMIQQPRWSYGTVFRRIRNEKSMAELRTDGMAGCLRTPRGGSGRQILFKAGFGKYAARLLSPIECARLMGAAEFNLDANAKLNQALFGFGDAVCVPVIEWIARHYLNPMVNELLRSQPQHALGQPA